MKNKSLFLSNYLRGLYLYKKKRYSDAEKSISKALSFDSEHAQGNFKLAMCYFHQKDWENAKVYFVKAIGLNPNKNWENQYTQVLRHLSLTVISTSTIAKETKIKEALEANNKDAKLYRELALILKKQSKWWQEIEALNSAISLDDSKAQWYYDLGDANYKMNRFDESSEAFGNAIRLKAGNAVWHYRLGDALEKCSKTHQAKDVYEKAIKLDKKLDSKKYGIGIFHQQRGMWKEAIEAYSKKIQNSSLDDELYYKLGMAYDRTYEWEEAEKCYSNALLINQNRPYTIYRLGFVCERMGKYSDAIYNYSLANDISKKKTAYWFYRAGYVNSLVGNYKAANRCFEKFANEHKLNKSNDSKLLFNSVNRTLPKSFLESLVTASNFFDTAKLSETYQDYETASNLYKKAVERNNEHNPEWYYRLGNALAKLDRYEEACEAFTEMRILKKPYGVPEDKYNKDKGFRQAAIYTEYYESLPIKDKTVLYESFHGASMSCNPYAIFLYLLEQKEYKDWTHIWVINDNEKIPEKFTRLDNVIYVKRQSYLYLKYLASAQVLINNVSFSEYFIRKENQKYLNTWHGTPMKYLGKDIKDSLLSHKNVARNFLHTTHMIHQNEHTQNILLNHYDIGEIYSGSSGITGYPRTDSTVNITNENKINVKNSLGINDEGTIILYAPTWRGLHGEAVFDTEKLMDDLKIMKNSGHHILFRGHHMIEKIISDVKLNVTIVPSSIDTNLLLGIVDLLITDYSSIAFDFMALEKPIVYYAYDIEDYKEQRGLYFPLEELAGEVCYSSDDLEESIQKSFTQNKDTYIKAKKHYCSLDDGKATARVVEYLFDNKCENIKLYQNSTKKSILIFTGLFIPNGITTSMLNLVNHIDLTKYSVTIIIEPNSIIKYPERIEQLERLKKEVSLVAKVGRNNQTLEEDWINIKFNALRTLQNKEMYDNYLRQNKREFKRLFGYASFDVAVNFDGYATEYIGLFSGFSKNKIVYQHNDLYGEFKARFAYLEKNFNLYKFYDKVISVSKQTMELNIKNLSHRFNVPKEKFAFVDNLQNPEEIFERVNETLDEQEEQELFGSDDKVFITLGRLSVEKDHSKLIKAFAKLRASNPKIKLLILGEGPLKHNLQILVKDLNQTKNVHLLGRRFNPFPFLNKADCFVLSSNHEGQPMVLLEALILGKPIVATDIVGNRSVLEGRPGLLVPNSEEGLVEGMEKYLEGEVTSESFDYEEYQKNALKMFYEKVCG